MYQQLEEKLKEQQALFPKHPEFRTWLSQSDLWNWIYSAFRIKGEPLSKTVVVDMLNGKIREDIQLSSYAFAQATQNVYKDMKNYIQMQTTLEPEMIYRWAKMLMGIDLKENDDLLLRENEPLVYEWELITIDHNEIKEKLNQIVKEYNSSVKTGDVFACIAKLHLQLNRLYAFGENTALLSLAVLMFTLLEHDYFMPELPVDDREYNRIVAKYFDDDSLEDFYSMLCRSEFNRLEAIINLSREAKEITDWTKA